MSAPCGQTHGVPIDEGPEIRQWVIQPYLDAGLGRVEIEDLTLRVAMHAFSTGASHASMNQLMALVADQTQELQAAFRENVERAQAVTSWKASAPGPPIA